MKQKDLLLIVIVLLMVGIVKFFRRGEVIISPDSKSVQPFYEHVDNPNSFSYAPEDFSDIRHIVIDNPAGSITILPAENRSVTVQSTLIIFSPNDRMVEKLRGHIDIHSRVSGDGILKITVEEPRKEDEGRFQANHTLWLPEGVSLDGATRYGNIEVAHILSSLKLGLRYGQMSVSDVTGEISLTAIHGQIDLINITGKQVLNIQSSDLTVENADGLEIVPRRSQLKLSGIRGKVLVSSALLSHINVDKALEVTISGSGNRISLANIAEGVHLDNEFEDIDLENVSGDISIASKRSRITLNAVRADSLFIRNSFRDTRLIRSGFGSARFELHQSDLDLDVTGIGRELVVEGVHSDVSLTVPKTLVFSADISSRMGNVTFQPDASFIEEKARGRHSIRRQVPGAVMVKLSTSYGEISLNSKEGE